MRLVETKASLRDGVLNWKSPGELTENRNDCGNRETNSRLEETLVDDVRLSRSETKNSSRRPSKTKPTCTRSDELRGVL